MAYIAAAKSLAQQLNRTSGYSSIWKTTGRCPFCTSTRLQPKSSSVYVGQNRVATMDLRIAAIVLSQGATLLSRNMVDFGKIPGLKVEDWTK